MQRFVLIINALSLAASAMAALSNRLNTASGGRKAVVYARTKRFCVVAALLLGVAGILVLLILFCMQAAYFVVDLSRGYPSPPTRTLAYNELGLWGILIVFSSCALGYWSQRDHRLIVCQFWLGVFLACWASLLLPPFRPNAYGGFEHTGTTLLLFSSLSVFLALAVVVVGRSMRSSEKRKSWVQSAREPEPEYLPPGFRVSCVALAAALGLLACYHLALPLRLGWGGYRGFAVFTAVASALVAFALYDLLRLSWSESLIDPALGFATLAVCGAATAIVPARPAPLADRYPMMFNALVFGLAFSTGMWTWCCRRWERRGKCESGKTGFHFLRLASHGKRFAFLSTSLGLLMGGLMAVWPRLPGIAAMDHSYGRVSAGLAGNLLFLLVLLWASREIRRLSFHLLTALTIGSTAAFLVVRMLPFASEVHG